MGDPYEHMSWCQGRHDGDGECQINHHIRTGDHAYEELSVLVLGVPCDHLNLEVVGAVFDLADLDGLIASLQGLRPVFVARESDVDCEHHNHDDEGNDEEGDTLVCEGCQQPAEEGVQLVEDVGYRCDKCCAALGVAWIDYGP